MICCNIDDSELLDDEKLSMYVKKSETVEINGVQIGFIGYVSKEDLVSSKAFKFLITVKLWVLTRTFCLEAHVDFFRLLMKGIFDPYVLLPFDKKSIF